MPSYFFALCPYPIAISLGEGLQTIGDYCFAGSPELKEIVIPSSVVSIGKDAFSSTNEGGDELIQNENIKIYLRGPEGSIPGAPWGAKEENIFWNYKGE